MNPLDPLPLDAAPLDRFGITRIVNAIAPSNTYVVRYSADRRVLIVDPGLDEAALDRFLVAHDLTPTHALCTHGHFDHIGGMAALQDRYGVTALIHPDDLPLVRSVNFIMMAFGIRRSIRTPVIPPMDGAEAVLPLDGAEVRLVHAPGHTPGSCFILYDRILFTGDTLYTGGFGLSKLPGENPGRLKGTLLDWWPRIPATSLICPGHGPAAPFADVRRRNTLLREFLGLDASDGPLDGTNGRGDG